MHLYLAEPQDFSASASIRRLLWNDELYAYTNIRRERSLDRFLDLFSEDIDYATGWRDRSFVLLSQMKKTIATKNGED